MQRFYALFTFLVLFALQSSAQNADCLNIYLFRADTSSLDTVPVEVRIVNHGGAIGLQYTTKWDPNVLELVGVTNFGLPGLALSNFSFGSPNVSQGLLSLSWHRLDSFYLPNHALLYKLLFVVKNKAASQTQVSFVNQPVSSEVTYNYRRAGAIPALIGTKLNLKKFYEPNPLRINQVCSALSTCKDTLTNVSVDVSGGKAPYRYFWTGGGRTYQTPTLSGALPGIYQLWVSDENRDTIPLLVGASLNAPGSSPIFLNATVICDDTSKQKATLRVSNLGLPGVYQFKWSNGFQESGVNTSSIHVNKDSLYSVTVTDANGCTGSIQGLSGRSCYPTPQDTIVVPPDTIITNPGGDNPKLFVESKIANTGKVFCTPVVADDFQNLSGLQFSLNWDPTHLTFQRVNYVDQNLVDVNTLGLGRVTLGELRFVKIAGSPTPLTFTEKVLFEVCFTPLLRGDSTQITFGGPGRLPTLAVNAQQNLIAVQQYSGIVITAPAIWPGDADGNGTVDQFDLLPIGLAYGSSGPARANAQITWEAHNAQKWQQTLVNSNIDLAFVDADGSGHIDAADTSAIARNWQRVHSDGLPKLVQPEIRSGGASLFIDADTVRSGVGQWFPLELGTATQTAEGVYGLAFSITYEPNQVKEAEMSFSAESSWLGTLGQDLMAFQRNNPAKGRIDVAITRIDGRNISGYGRIGKVKITIEDVILNLRDEENPKVKLGIDNVRLINRLDENIPVSPLPSTPTAKKEVSTFTYDPHLSAQIRVYPQPAQDQLFLDYGDLPLRSVQLLQLDGKALTGVLVPQRNLSLAGIPNGVYFLKVVAERGVAMKKVLITR